MQKDEFCFAQKHIELDMAVIWLEKIGIHPFNKEKQ